jgi:hypothetical protein
MEDILLPFKSAVSYNGDEYQISDAGCAKEQKTIAERPTKNTATQFFIFIKNPLYNGYNHDLSTAGRIFLPLPFFYRRH